MGLHDINRRRRKPNNLPDKTIEIINIITKIPNKI